MGGHDLQEPDRRLALDRLQDGDGCDGVGRPVIDKQRDDLSRLTRRVSETAGVAGGGRHADSRLLLGVRLPGPNISSRLRASPQRGAVACTVRTQGERGASAGARHSDAGRSSSCLNPNVLQVTRKGGTFVPAGRKS
jgi:hypothetical protein